MKKLIKSICLILTLVTLSVSFFGCSEPQKMQLDGDYLVITIDSETFKSGDTLKSYMERLRQSERLDFVMSDGMVLSINGKKAEQNQFWALYHDDTEYSDNSFWCEYNGKVYDTSIVGAGDLPVKVGCTYVWNLQTF